MNDEETGRSVAPGAGKAPRGVRLFAIRVRRRLASPVHAARVRWFDRIGAFNDGSVPRSADSPYWSPLAGLPGDPAEVQRIHSRPQSSARHESYVEEVFAHRLTLLSADAVDVSATAPAPSQAFRRLAASLPVSAVESYRAIDWHRDPRSGYRWDPTQFYLDVRVAPVPGAEIKFPRELSRFQHVGALAAGSPEAGGLEFLLEALDWIAANPERRGVNWACTMDIAIRAVNWIWALRLFEPVIAAYPEAEVEIRRSLHAHGRHIERNLEYYEEVTSNHYVSNVVGLLYIGAAFPEFPESDRWLLFGLQELVSEMKREVFRDGATQEASTNYHRLVAEMFASGAALAERVPPTRLARLRRADRRKHRVRPPLRHPDASGLTLSGDASVLPVPFYERLARMGEFTAALTKPNGFVPQVGDNDSARLHKLSARREADVRDHRHLAAAIGELLAREDFRTLGVNAADEARLVYGGLAGRLPSTRASVDIRDDAILFPDAGIAVVRRGPAYLAVTCGTNGQEGRGGHGHNDKLSFELNVRGVDLIVDGGCPAYTSDPASRNRFRGTAAHSTIAVEGREQDMWAPGPQGLFRLPERSTPRLALAPDGTVGGQHSGFGATHRREFRLSANRLEISDTLTLGAPRRLVFNLDPAIWCADLSAESGEVRCTLLDAEGRTVRLCITGADSPRIEPGCFSLGYGVPVATSRLTMRLTGESARTTFSWEM